MYIMYSLLCCHTGKRIHNMGILGFGACVLCCRVGRAPPLVDVGFCVWRWLKLFVKLSKYHSDYSFINLFCCFCVKVMRSRAFFCFFCA